MRFWDVVALGVNGMIGAGIFLLPGVIAEHLGPSAVLAAMLAGLIAAMNVLCFAKIAQHYSTTGGAYLYAKDYLGRAVGFEIGWLNWCSRMLSWAAIAHGFAIALRSQIGAGSPAWLYPVAVTGLIVSLSALNLRGVVFGARVSTFFTLAKLVPILVFITIAAVAFDPQRFVGVSDFKVQALGDATLVVFWAFLGFESVVVTAGEMRNPAKMMWPALVTIIAVVTAVYLLVITMVFGSLDHVAGRENPVVDASRELMGPFGSQMISLGILISVFGMASAHALVAPRCVFAMAEHHDLPKPVAWIHAVYRTPVIAIALSGAITLALAFSGSFKDLAVLSVLARFTQYITTAIAVLMMTMQQHKDKRWTLSRARSYFIPIATLAASLWVMGQASYLEWLKVMIAGGLGLPLLFLALYKERAAT
jgi:amino acid transporter